MKREMKVRIGAVSGALLFVCGAAAERYSFVGHRAQGMGGTGAATANDASAQWHNPAAFGFFNREADPVDGVATNAITNVVNVVTNMPADAAAADTNAVAEVSEGDTNAVAAASVPVTNQTYEITYETIPAEVIPDRARADNMKLEENDWGWNMLGVGFGYTMTEDMPEYVTLLGGIDFDSFDGGGLENTVEAVESMIQLSTTLYGLGSNPDNAFYVDTTAGMNFRFGRWGIGARMFGEVAGFVDNLDTDRVGIEQSQDEFSEAIADASTFDFGFDPVGYTYKTINPGDLTVLSGASEEAVAEAYIDYQLTRMKNNGTLTKEMVDDSVEMINYISFGADPDDPNSDSIENNRTTVTARGFGLFEVPLSYGYAFNDNLSVGITAKGMYGTVTGTKVQATNEDSFDAAVDHLEDNTEASFNFGLDLGVLYRMKMLQFACVAHNINAPKFKGFTDDIEIENDAGEVIDSVKIHVPDYTIDPQVTLGAAFVPSKRFMIEMSYDLLETGTLMENYNIQRIAFGTELDIWVLAFRLGAYNNLAADWQDWIATGGLGLNLWALRLDVGGAYSIGENAEYEGTEIPEEARLYAALSMEF